MYAPFLLCDNPSTINYLTSMYFLSSWIGDFAEDLPFNCPATTTCPVVCVTNVTDCPTVCTDGLTLCTSGHCAEDCTLFDTFENPCSCGDLVVSCPKVVDLFDLCYERFQTPYYDNVSTCKAIEEAAVPLLSWTGPWFLACYIGLATVSALVVGWCFFNQKLWPVKTSTMTLMSSSNNTNSTWTQTGYKVNIMGLFVYVLVNVSMIWIQILMFYLVIMYYVNQESITRFPMHFESEIQVLKAFQIVWMVGFVWYFIFRYPDTGLYNLFLRRCKIQYATHVAVVAPKKSIEDVTFVPNIYGQVLASMWSPIDSVFRMIFSYPYGIPGYDTTFCPVSMDRSTGTRSILHRMRRYVYDEETGGFVPFTLVVGTTFGELLDQINGLTEEEVTLRRGHAGPNVIPLPKPSIIGCIYNEFSKSFYIYQNFILWAYANFFYYYMAITHTFVRVGGGLVVAYFQYVNESTLYKLARVEGSVEYVNFLASNIRFKTVIY
jgi:Cation transporter/ATPase, N-terminus